MENAKTEIIAYKINDSPFALEPAPSARSWMNETHGHANKCLPLLASNQMGWIIRNPCDITAVWNGGESKLDTKVVIEDDSMKELISSHFGWGIITWQLPWLFRTNEKVGLMVRGCTNFWVENAQALDGFVETFWSPYTFTFNWKILQPHVPVTWKKGDPVCMIIPYPVDFLEDVTATIEKLTDNTELHKTYQEWSTYRNKFNEGPRPRDGSASWQKDYFVGKKCPFAHGPDNVASHHKTKFVLPDFQDKTS